MSKPAVVIAGRPNVGKSSVFNFLAGRRISIVEPTAGVTRDRVSTPIKYEGHQFELVDTGGMGIKDMDNLTAEVEHQIEIALQKADLILLVTDVQQGIVPQDHEISARLRRLNKPIILVANKADSQQIGAGEADFYSLGLGEPLLTSTTQSIGFYELMDAIVQNLPEPGPAAAAEAAPVTFAIVGKRNAGKSTFINALVEEERVIVSERPGTTRDAVDVYFEKDGRTYIAIDTAGLRKRGQVAHSIEFFSIARAESAIRRADVVLLFIDAVTPVSQVDKKLAMMVRDSMKACAIVVNKWDLAQDKSTSEYEHYFSKVLPGLDFAPIVFTSAKQGRNVSGVLETVRALYKQSTVRVPTAALNEVLMEALRRRSPRPVAGKLPKLYYGTQTNTAPPTVVLFVNNPKIFDSPYRRYLANYLRERLPFHEIPIRIHFRARARSESKAARG